MPTYTFKPSGTAFPGSKVEVTIEVTKAGRDWFVNGNPLSAATIDHAVAFAIKQRLANSFVNAATARDESGAILPQRDREVLWESLLTKMIDKITDPDAAPNWEAVFTGGGGSLDPMQREVFRLVAGNPQLKAWWSKRGDPKDWGSKGVRAAWNAIAAAEDGTKAAAIAEAIRAEAARRVEAAKAVTLTDDDLGLD